MQIVVTGASGFVGKRFMEYNKSRYELIALSLRAGIPANIDLMQTGSLVHLAGKAHEMKAVDDKLYFEINFELTRKLADEAKKQGVRQFIYISSVKVYGNMADAFVDETTTCKPDDAYGKSKLAAEEYLRSIEDAHFRVAIIRPPLVYGPGVKGNMIRFLALAEKKLPLPFGGIDNKRSMVFIDNLVELINRVAEREARGIFTAGDPEAISTGYLLGLIREYMNNRKGLISLPAFGRKLLKVVRPALFERLFGSFVVDNRKTNQVLGFSPPYSTEYGVKVMVDWYLQHKKPRNLKAAIK
jgi:nucleoside-diphosphate-sugar epimerase